MVSFLVAIASRDDERAGVSEATASSSSSFRSIYVVSTLVFVVGFTAFVGVQLLVGSRHLSTNPSLSCPSSCSKNSFARRWVGPKIQVPAALGSRSSNHIFHQRQQYQRKIWIPQCDPKIVTNAKENLQCEIADGDWHVASSSSSSSSSSSFEQEQEQEEEEEPMSSTSKSLVMSTRREALHRFAILSSILGTMELQAPAIIKAQEKDATLSSTSPASSLLTSSSSESFPTQQVRAYLLGTKEAEQALTYKAEYCKIVYFVRHGQGYHNLGKRSPVDKLARCNDMDLFDASLTSVGEDQASRIQDISLKLRPEIIYVSPMRRTLQTGTLAFKTVDVPFIAFEELREVYGCTSSQRRKASIAKAEFPKVDFSRITEDDLEWTAVESPGHLKERQIRFLNYIRNRPERTLGVVTHSLWLLNFFRETVACTEPALTNSIFNTGELKGVVLQMDGFD